jgi:hypothetical protein
MSAAESNAAMARAAIVTGTSVMRSIMVRLRCVVMVVVMMRMSVICVFSVIPSERRMAIGARSFALAQRVSHEDAEEHAYREGGHEQDKYRCCSHN